MLRAHGSEARFQPGDDIGLGLKTDREPQQVVTDTGRAARLGAHSGVSHGRRVSDKAFDPTSDSASVKTSTASTNRRTLSTPPASSKLSIAPNPACCALAMPRGPGETSSQDNVRRRPADARPGTQPRRQRWLVDARCAETRSATRVA